MISAANVGQPNQKKKLFGSRPPLSPVLRSPTTTKRSPQQRECCSIDCMGGYPSSLSAGKRRQAKVAELERELQRQRELQAAYRSKFEMMQEYLMSCLLIAHENGFLDLVVHHHQNYSPCADLINTINARFPPTGPTDPYLSAVATQAKVNGWYIEPHEIELHEKVGQGATANIYRGRWQGLDVAVKCISPDYFHSSENSFMWFAHELATLSRQRHPFILHLMGACFGPPEHGWIVTEFLSGGTLKQFLHGPTERGQERSTPLPPLKERIEKGLEIALAMQHLHEKRPKVLHRDLKPSNIFLDDALHVRVADFGHSRFLLEGEMARTGETGTYVYMAPEVIRSDPYTEKCDVYSFGIILNELITGQYPYVDTDYGPMEIATEVGEGKLRPMLPDDSDGQLDELIRLIRLAWDEDPSSRPSFATITSTLRKIKEQLYNPSD